MSIIERVAGAKKLEVGVMQALVLITKKEVTSQIMQVTTRNWNRQERNFL